MRILRLSHSEKDSRTGFFNLTYSEPMHLLVWEGDFYMLERNKKTLLASPGLPHIAKQELSILINNFFRKKTIFAGFLGVI